MYAHGGEAVPTAYGPRGKLRLNLTTAQFKLLYNVANFLKPMDIPVLLGMGMRNHQKRRFLEQYHFIGGAHLAKFRQVGFDLVNVRDKGVDDRRPCLVKRFVPDGGLEARHAEPLRVRLYQIANLKRSRDSFRANKS